jgi:hypothetical protein
MRPSTCNTVTRLPYEFAGGERQRPVCTVCGRKRCGEHKNKCHTCHDKAWRLKFPAHHLWNNLKKSARRRGYEFTIRKTWFAEWCQRTCFVETCGRTKGCASIDRIEPWRGYHEDNIQILEVGANSAKGQNPPPINYDETPYAPGEHPFHCDDY